MAKAKKAGLSLAPKSGTVPGIATKLVDKLLLSAKTMLQSVTQFEVELQACAVKCLEHAEQHGDTMPMDRLVKGLMGLNHPATTRLAQEVVAWARGISPIRWDSKGNVKQLKEGEEGYKPYDVTGAEETPFNETAMAKRAREASDKAHAKGLKPLTYQDVLNRVKGLRHTVARATEADKNGEVRTIAKGDATKIRKLLDAVESAAGIGGEEEAKKAA